MHNPWLELSLNGPYMLSVDSEAINRYNSRHPGDRDREIKLSVLPEPFIGNPQSATVVLLHLNPGHSSADKRAHSVAPFRNAILRNLRHEPQDYPFYYLNPEFDNPGAKWWRSHLRELFDKTKLDLGAVARRMCVIEWFPYHSRRGGVPRCPSQQYSFEIARSALSTKLVVGMRAKQQWTDVDQRFASIPYLKNPRNPCISVGNAGESVFAEIARALSYSE